MHPFTLSRATSVSDAVGKLDPSAGDAFLAGGTTLVDLIKLDVLRPRQLVDLRRVGLNEIETLPSGGLRLGALVRNSDLARHPLVRARFPGLAEALLSGASAQLRNMATTGGNLLQRTRCSYFRDGVSACNKRVPGSGCAALTGPHRSHAILGVSPHCIATHPSDFAVALAVLDASIHVEGPDGPRSIPFGEFHLLPGDTPDREFALLPGEVITAVTLPPPHPHARSWYLKVRDRESYAFALASAAVWAVPSPEENSFAEVRIALGGVATKPWRAHEAEAVLQGRTWSEEAFATAARAALHGAQPRVDNRFKIELAQRVLVRALAIVAAGQPSVRNT